MGYSQAKRVRELHCLPSNKVFQLAGREDAHMDLSKPNVEVPEAAPSRISLKIDEMMLLHTGIPRLLKSTSYANLPLRKTYLISTCFR